MEPLQAARAFRLAGAVRRIRPYGAGLIHHTFLVEAEGGRRAVLQRLNTAVFPDPDAVMANLRGVLDHLADRADEARPLVFPRLIPTREGGDWLDDAGGPWRMLSFVDGRGLARCPGPAEARQAGFALGRFHRLLAELDPGGLRPALRGFHDTPAYLAALEARVAGARLEAGAREAWAFIRARRGWVAEFAAARPRLHHALVHGDPKFDNLLFTGAGRALSLVDLDTVQRAPRLLDIADALRSCCNPAGEDPPAPEAVRFEPSWCRAWLEAYLEEADLGEVDRRWFYPALRLLPLELGMRFLADHLAGDRYFKTTRPGQNLHRAQVQLALVRAIEAGEETLRDAAAG